MKITYIISNINSQSKGNGGHYYSLLSTVSAIGKIHEIRIVNIGSNESMAFKNSGIEIVNIIDKELNNFKLLKQLFVFLKTDKPDLLHVFDEFAFFYVRVINVLLKKPIVLTKCGGGNPKYFYPLCKNLIVYSKENLIFFKTVKKYRNSNILHIPNRVSEFESDGKRILELREKFHLVNYKFVFLRIARIGKAYRKSIIELIKIVNQLNDKNISTCLLLIGTIEDISVFEEIKSYPLNNIFVENDKYYTQNSKELIEIADVVLGTGRSFMEASLKNRIMLAPINYGANIVLVDGNNFEELFETNFSERGQVNSFDQISENVKIIDVLINSEIKEKILNDNKIIFNTNFNIEYAINEYSNLYNIVMYKPSFQIFDTFFNYFFLNLMFRRNKVAENKNYNS